MRERLPDGSESERDGVQGHGDREAAVRWTRCCLSLMATPMLENSSLSLSLSPRKILPSFVWFWFFLSVKCRKGGRRQERERERKGLKRKREEESSGEMEMMQMRMTTTKRRERERERGWMMESEKGGERRQLEGKG